MWMAGSMNEGFNFPAELESARNWSKPKEKQADRRGGTSSTQGLPSPMCFSLGAPLQRRRAKKWLTKLYESRGEFEPPTGPARSSRSAAEERKPGGRRPGLCSGMCFSFVERDDSNATAWGAPPPGPGAGGSGGTNDIETNALDLWKALVAPRNPKNEPRPANREMAAETTAANGPFTGASTRDTALVIAAMTDFHAARPGEAAARLHAGGGDRRRCFRAKKVGAVDQGRISFNVSTTRVLLQRLAN